MSNWGYNYAYELYSIRDSVINKNGFSVSKLPNPDRLTIDNEEQCFDSSSTTITLLWNTVPGFLYDHPDYRYVLLRYNDDDECFAFMMRNTAFLMSYNEWKAIFLTVSPDIDVLKAVLEYRAKTTYTKYFNHSNADGVRRISKERDTFMNALQNRTITTSGYGIVKNRVNTAFGYGIGNVPLIKEIFYNEPHTVIKWNDGTTTIVGCAEGEEFSKELGLSVAIAEKYFEELGFPYPRAALKKFAENGHDQTAKTKARKKFKADKKARKIVTEE